MCVCGGGRGMGACGRVYMCVCTCVMCVYVCACICVWVVCGYLLSCMFDVTYM